MKTSLFKLSILSIAFSFFYTCERELTTYDLISFERCDSENVTVNPYIITDFECQSNIEISGVSVIRNPSETGINTSRFVGEYIDGASATDALTIDFANGLDLSTNPVFKFKVKTTTTGTLQIQLIGGSNGILNYDDIIISGNEIWTEYELDLSDQQGETFTQFNLIFNSGIENNGNDVYLIDDLRFDVFVDPCENVATDLSIINDFDCQQNYLFGDDPIQSSVPIVDNPFISGINLSENVGQYIDNGTEPFDNLLINFENAIDLSENTIFKIKIYSTITGPLLVKLEGGTTPIQISTTIESVNQWVEYSFNFSEALNSGNDKLVIFFNAGNTTGTTTDVYYIDDLRFDVDLCTEIVENCDGVVPDLSIISDFDCQQNYPFSDPNAAPVVQNPNVSCENRSSNVGEYTDNGTLEFDFLSVNYGAPIDLSVNNQLKLKVLSTMEVPLLAKLEGGNQNVEISADITIVNEWVEYTFDFSGGAEDNENTTLVLFFNSGNNNGTPQDIYYVDDIRFEAP